MAFLAYEYFKAEKLRRLLDEETYIIASALERSPLEIDIDSVVELVNNNVNAILLDWYVTGDDHDGTVILKPSNPRNSGRSRPESYRDYGCLFGLAFSTALYDPSDNPEESPDVLDPFLTVSNNIQYNVAKHLIELQCVGVSGQRRPAVVLSSRSQASVMYEKIGQNLGVPYRTLSIGPNEAHLFGFRVITDSVRGRIESRLNQSEAYKLTNAPELPQ